MSEIPRRFSPVRALATMQENEAAAADLVAGLSVSQFHAPSAKGGWSIGFCLEHLVLAGQEQVSQWPVAMGVRSAVAPRPYSVYERWQLFLLEPPYRWRRHASARTVPSGRRSIADTLRRFQAMHQDLARFVEASGSSRPFSSPVLAGSKHEIGFLIESLLAHERRHLWQAGRQKALFMDLKSSPGTLAK